VRPLDRVSAASTMDFTSRMGGQLTELGKYSFGIWDHLAKDEAFQSKVGYKDHCFLEKGPGKGLGVEEVPDWFQADPSWHVNEESFVAQVLWCKFTFLFRFVSSKAQLKSIQ
jgi:hypothetical protein